MAWLTPRKRLLITAPLAIILPAGLLSFLGLKTIRILDESFSNVTNELIRKQMHMFQYMFEREIRECEEDFLDSVHVLCEERSGNPRIKTRRFSNGLHWMAVCLLSPWFFICVKGRI